MSSKGRRRSKSLGTGLSFLGKKGHRRNLYSNEFENDESSRGSHSRSGSVANMQDSKNSFDRLKRIETRELLAELSNANTNILFDSLIKVYSAKRQSYVDVASILTKQNLYFVSPINYQIWTEIRDRTKANEILDDVSIIGESIAVELCTNLDITDNEQIIASKLLPYFIGKTKRTVKLDVLLNETGIASVADVFEVVEDHKSNEDIEEIAILSDDDILGLSPKAQQITTTVQIKYIDCVKIENINIIEPEYIDDFMIYIFDKIPYIDEEGTYNSKIITLQQYYSHSVINYISQKKHEFCEKHNILCSDTIDVMPHQKTMIISKHRKCKMLSLKKFKTIEPVTLEEIPYCFILKGKKEEITVRLKSNNQRHEWITHLDYAIKSHKYLNDIPYEDNKEDNQIQIMNDYTTTETADDSKEEFATNFSFGVYLNYWESGYENSVVPKFGTLKEELFLNKYKRLKKKQYYNLYEECKGLYFSKRSKIYALKVQDIGVNCKKFNIHKGEPITINHLLSLKVYTDFSKIQLAFKKACRKKRKDELLKDLIKRNREIAHWCRYMKECCTFYGKLMGKKPVFTGLNNKLLFPSLKQHFECPLSTTTDVNIANRFATESGIILKLKRANAKTRYLDVSWLSDYPQEKERLIMGSSLRICDIIIKCKASNSYVSAIHIFEKIMDGQFIDSKKVSEDRLYTLIQHAMHMSSINSTEDAPHKYFMALFLNMVQTLKTMNESQSLWINQQELDTIQNEKLRQLLIDGAFFNFCGIHLQSIHWVKQYLWKIESREYVQFVDKKTREYIESSTRKYDLNVIDSIQFHFEICAKYSDEAENVAFFLYLNEYPANIEQIRIVFDLSCVLSDPSKKSRKYRHLMTAQWLSFEKNHCGFQVFPSEDLKQYSSISWNVGVKIVEIAYKTNIGHLEKQKSIDIDNVSEALQNNDHSTVLQIFDALYQENNQLKSYNKQKDETIEALKEEMKRLTQSVNYQPPTPTNNCNPFSPDFLNSPLTPSNRSLSYSNEMALALTDYRSDPLNQTSPNPKSNTHTKFLKQKKRVKFGTPENLTHNKSTSDGGLVISLNELKFKNKSRNESNKKRRRNGKVLLQSATSESGSNT